MSDILMYDKIGNGGKYNEWLLLKIGDNVLFDTHVHLNDKKYAQDLLEVMERAKNEGVTRMHVDG